MGYPNTHAGYNVYDMYSMMQKAIRRGSYEEAGFAAKQIEREYRASMWNRILVISAEDCFGVITKEIVELKKADDINNDSRHISNAVALLCRSQKSRDACYFACNFILASRIRENLEPEAEEAYQFLERIGEDTDYDSFGFGQMSLFDEEVQQKPQSHPFDETETWECLQLALNHLDIDMIGYIMDVCRRNDRQLIWKVFVDYSEKYIEELIESEIIALWTADNMVNKKKQDLSKDEIFISKAAMLICHAIDPNIGSLNACDIIKLERNIEWKNIKVKSIDDCILANGKIPEYTYDCHTLEGKKRGKTDWDMTTTEQAALYPLRLAYFDNASWWHTYLQDREKGSLSDKLYEIIKEFAETHEVNPVRHIPYGGNK